MHCLQRLTGSLLAASFVCLGASAHPTPAPPSPALLQATLQAEYDNMNAAEAHGHVARYLSYHTADYVETDLPSQKGEHTEIHGRQQDRVHAISVTQWIRHFNAVNHDTVHYHDTIKSVRVAGEGVVVTAEERDSIQPQLVELEQDTWVNQGAHWRMKQHLHGHMYVRESGEPQRQLY